MTNRPILFSGPMVRALIEGRKTQTRRVLKLPPNYGHAIVTRRGLSEKRHVRLIASNDDAFDRRAPKTPETGDRLWVREAYQLPAILNTTPPRKVSSMSLVRYPANEGRDMDEDGDGNPIKLRPGIHMPRWASRLTLVVTDVRVQRLQEIAPVDAVAEGIPRLDPKRWGHLPEVAQNGMLVSAFADLWESINGPDAWDANPWVVATTFTVHKVKIDQMETASC